MSLVKALIIFLAFAIAALPLHVTIKILGGRTNFIKTMVMNVILGLLAAVLYLIFPAIILIPVIIMIWLYRETFRLKWWKALLAWFIQGFVAALLFLFFVAVLGLSLLL